MPAAPATSSPRAPAGELGDAQRERWRGVVEKVKEDSRRHGASLAFGRVVSLAPGEAHIAFTDKHSFHRAAISSTGGKSRVEKALSEHFGRPTRLVIDPAAVADEAPPSLAEEDASSREAYARSTEATLRRHPAVVSTLRMLGGEIEHIQVTDPRDEAAASTDAEGGTGDEDTDP